MIEHIISLINRVNKKTKDRWSVTIENGGKGFIRNKNNPDQDRYFLELNEALEILQLILNPPPKK